MENIKKIYYSLISAGLLLPFSLVSAIGGDVEIGGGISNPIGVKSIEGLIEAILKIVVAVGTPVAVLFLVFSGFKFVTAQGKPDAIKEARQYFMWTLVGIVILLGASLLSTIIKGTIEQLGAGI